MKASVRTARSQLLLRALFVTAVAAVEPLLGRLLPRLYLQQSPERYASLADPALAKVVRKAGYGGSEHWRKVLGHRLGLTVLDTVVPWAALETAWDERNSLHHKGGHKAHEAGLPLGETTEITVGYLRDTIDRVQVAMLAVVMAGMDSLQPGSAGPFAQMSATGFPHAYRGGQWDLAEGLAALRMAFPVEQDSAVGAQVEVWMARVGLPGRQPGPSEPRAGATASARVLRRSRPLRRDPPPAPFGIESPEEHREVTVEVGDVQRTDGPHRPAALKVVGTPGALLDLAERPGLLEVDVLGDFEGHRPAIGEVDVVVVELMCASTWIDLAGSASGVVADHRRRGVVFVAQVPASHRPVALAHRPARWRAETASPGTIITTAGLDRHPTNRGDVRR